MAPDQRPDIETLVVAIARSPIVMARAAVVRAAAAKACESVRVRLPEGFEDADLAILRWIAEEGRRAGRHLFKH
jgi:adenine-specific DNA methylase